MAEPYSPQPNKFYVDMETVNAYKKRVLRFRDVVESMWKPLPGHEPWEEIVFTDVFCLRRRYVPVNNGYHYEWFTVSNMQAEHRFLPDELLHVVYGFMVVEAFHANMVKAADAKDYPSSFPGTVLCQTAIIEWQMIDRAEHRRAQATRNAMVQGVPEGALIPVVHIDVAPSKMPPPPSRRIRRG